MNKLRILNLFVIACLSSSVLGSTGNPDGTIARPTSAYRNGKAPSQGSFHPKRRREEQDDDEPDTKKRKGSISEMQDTGTGNPVASEHFEHWNIFGDPPTGLSTSTLEPTIPLHEFSFTENSWGWFDEGILNNFEGPAFDLFAQSMENPPQESSIAEKPLGASTSNSNQYAAACWSPQPYGLNANDQNDTNNTVQPEEDNSADMTKSVILKQLEDSETQENQTALGHESFSEIRHAVGVENSECTGRKTKPTSLKSRREGVKGNVDCNIREIGNHITCQQVVHCWREIEQAFAGKSANQHQKKHMSCLRLIRRAYEFLDPLGKFNKLVNGRAVRTVCRDLQKRNLDSTIEKLDLDKEARRNFKSIFGLHGRNRNSANGHSDANANVDCNIKEIGKHITCRHVAYCWKEIEHAFAGKPASQYQKKYMSHLRLIRRAYAFLGPLGKFDELVDGRTVRAVYDDLRKGNLDSTIEKSDLDEGARKKFKNLVGTHSRSRNSANGQSGANGNVDCNIKEIGNHITFQQVARCWKEIEQAYPKTSATQTQKNYIMYLRLARRAYEFLEPLGRFDELIAGRAVRAVYHDLRKGNLNSTITKLGLDEQQDKDFRHHLSTSRTCAETNAVSIFEPESRPSYQHIHQPGYPDYNCPASHFRITSTFQSSTQPLYSLIPSNSGQVVQHMPIARDFSSLQTIRPYIPATAPPQTSFKPYPDI